MNWKDAWGSSPDMLRNLDNYFPIIPDQLVTPILTDNQREVWDRIPKRQSLLLGFGGVRATLGGDPLDDPELVEAQKEADAKEKK